MSAKTKTPKNAGKSIGTKAARRSLKTVQDKPATSNQQPATGNRQKELQPPATSKKSPFPKDLQPMLATLVDKPFDAPGWIYELKWDGYRALAYLNQGNVDIRSRNNKSFNEKFYPVYDALKQWKLNAVLDGEIVVVNEKGLADFTDLQNWRSEADGHLIYYLFDILWLNGSNLMELPLKDRRKMLRSLTGIAGKGLIQLSDEFDSTGTELFELAKKTGLEGIIAKEEDSIYIPGVRTKEWLKIKTEKRQELIIGGYTRNENSSKQFSALLLGWYQNGEFQHVCPVGTGFNNKTQTEILQRLKPLVTPDCPFKEVPDYNKPSRFRPNPPKAEVTWVKPEVVVEISYRELTKDGAIRHPSFKGLREDKNASEVTSLPQDAGVKPPANEEAFKADAIITKNIIVPAKTERKTFLNPKDETQVRSINGHDLKFTNLSKIYWPAYRTGRPKEKISKRDMLNYYYQVAPYMLPYMKDRPQTLNRFPHGINGESFYQKDVTGKVPDWIAKFPYHSETDNRDKNFLVCTNEASLLYIASLGCIEMNPWSSRIQSPDNPDWCIIDLDPDKNPFDEVIKAAQVTKEVLDTFGVPAYCKTSGSTGLHIYIPLGAKYDYEQSKEFGRMIVKLVNTELPSFTSIERYTEKRKGKLYLDFLQNRPQATVAGPYSLRPKPGAPVSAPLHWDEVKKGMRIQDFNIFNMMDRLKDVGDLFKPVLGRGVKLEKIMKNPLSP